MVYYVNMIAAEKVKSDVARFPEHELRTALTDFWKKQIKDRQTDPFAPKPSGGGTLYDLLPALDSLTIVRSFVVVEKVLKMKIPVGLVKKGGYDSREQMLQDLIPKLQKIYAKRSTKITI